MPDKQVGRVTSDSSALWCAVECGSFGRISVKINLLHYQWVASVNIGNVWIHPRPKLPATSDQRYHTHITQYGSTVYIGIAMVYPH